MASTTPHEWLPCTDGVIPPTREWKRGDRCEWKSTDASVELAISLHCTDAHANQFELAWNGAHTSGNSWCRGSMVRLAHRESFRFDFKAGTFAPFEHAHADMHEDTPIQCATLPHHVRIDDVEQECVRVDLIARAERWGVDAFNTDACMAYMTRVRERGLSIYTLDRRAYDDDICCVPFLVVRDVEAVHRELYAVEAFGVQMGYAFRWL